jgi:uncharacterized lipoprotein YddW (UPF0748 family)
MQSRGRHFEELTSMLATSDHPLIPSSTRTASLETSEVWDARWKEFRQQGINLLIKNIYEQVREKHPGVVISVTITSDKEEAVQRYLQDWSAWLEGGYIDFLIPRGYVERVRDLGNVLTAWQPEMQARSPIVIGLKAYVETDQSEAPKTPGQLLAEIMMARQAGSDGIMVFDLEHMSDEQLRALARGPFSSPAMP